MRAPHQLVHSRARIRPRYAMFPLEGYPASRSPLWTNTEIRVLTAPAMGANFVEHHVTMGPGGGTKRRSTGGIESFVYVLSGQANLFLDGAIRKQPLVSGSFAFIPATSD